LGWNDIVKTKGDILCACQSLLESYSDEGSKKIPCFALHLHVEARNPWAVVEFFGTPLSQLSKETWMQDFTLFFSPY
jgi:hypothetical protein